ncbi:MAG TPA: peptide chain release factor-like protein [Coriobacteriia bacterium]|nr:peptide chain release factor-like protein [Coriobacteriia bacterium]
MDAGPPTGDGRRDNYEIPATDAGLLAECEVHVFRGTGPGGQSVNTTDSAVRLVHRPSGVTVVCRRERSQLRNKTECVRRLRARLEALGRTNAPRVPTAPSAAARARRTDGKARRARAKRLRRPPEDDE